MSEELRVGTHVHYVYNLGYKYICVPAVVMHVYDKDTGNIDVREFKTMDYKSCMHSQDYRAGGTWHCLSECEA